MADDLLKILELDFLEKISKHSGLAIFGKHRSKFEGWLKVELIGILADKGQNPIPEHDTIDIKFDGGVIELKTINTNYTYPDVYPKGKPITNNIDSVIKDIQKLKNKCFDNKYVAFIVFPAEHNNLIWQQHYRKIFIELSSLERIDFKFKNGIPGIFYCGKI